MRAAFYERNGPARQVLQVGELPDPKPAPGEVRVRIYWSGVNPSDVKTRAGSRGPLPAFPRMIPHSDGMGMIDAVGDGVSKRRVGERVWLWNAAWGRPNGTAANFVCLPQAMAVHLPEATVDEAGACLGIPALTALHAVLLDGGVVGKTVLVAGGAGAVGHYAVQFASRLGAARIISTVSSPVKAALAQSAGADEIVNYKTEPVAERVRELTGGVGVDRVIELDLAANGRHSCDALRMGGECVVYGSSPDPLNLSFRSLLDKSLQLKFFLVYQLADADRARARSVLQRLLMRGDLIHNIAERVPLEQIVRGHELVQSGEAIGNVVMDCR